MHNSATWSNIHTWIINVHVCCISTKCTIVQLIWRRKKISKSRNRLRILIQNNNVNILPWLKTEIILVELFSLVSGILWLLSIAALCNTLVRTSIHMNEINDLKLWWGVLRPIYMIIIKQIKTSNHNLHCWKTNERNVGLRNFELSLVYG